MASRRLLRWALRWYPRDWRGRYGEEFAALLDELPGAGWATVWDVWKGAIDMQLHRNGRPALRLVMWFGLAGLVAAAAISMTVPDRYVAPAVLEVNAGVDEKQLSEDVRKALAPERLSALIVQHALYKEDRESLRTLRKNITVSGVQPFEGGRRRAIRIVFHGDDPRVVQSVTNALAASVTAGGRLSVLDSAPSPEAYYPNRPVFAFTGLLAGAILGAAWAAWRHHRRSSIPQ
jgi:hypothetical protein